MINRCFPHVINLAVQAIYAMLKSDKKSDMQYLLGNLPEPTEEVLSRRIVYSIYYNSTLLPPYRRGERGGLVRLVVVA